MTTRTMFLPPGRAGRAGGAEFMDDVDVLGQLTADGAGIDGQLAVDYSGDRVAEFTTDSASADAHVVHVGCTETEALTEGVAVYGKWEQSGECGVGGQFYGGRIGAEGRAEDAGGIQIHTGVYGHATNANGNYGVYGEATGGVHTYVVYGTASGAPGPGLYVAEEVSGNSFAIAGGEPGMKVSWQVTGIRQDASALEHRMEVELIKNTYEAGKYLNPELYGMPETAAVHYRGDR